VRLKNRSVTCVLLCPELFREQAGDAFHCEKTGGAGLQDFFSLRLS